jgi:SAM-dependent methyltransferase
MIPFDVVMTRRARGLCARLLPYLHGRARGRVLDVGSGTGHTASALASAGLEVATADVVDMRVVGPAPVIFDGERLPFADGAFDHALVIHVLQYPRDAARLLREVSRVARRVLLIQSTCTRLLGRVHLTLHEAAWGEWAYRAAHTASWVKPPPAGASPLLARRALSPEQLAQLVADARLRPVAHACRRWWSRHVDSELYVLERHAS